MFVVASKATGWPLSILLPEATGVQDTQVEPQHLDSNTKGPPKVVLFVWVPTTMTATLPIAKPPLTRSPVPIMAPRRSRLSLHLLFFSS